MAEPNTLSLGRQVLAVSGMSCGGCVNSVERALLRVPGVERAVVDLAAGQAVVEGNVSTEALVNAVQEAGYEVHPA